MQQHHFILERKEGEKGSLPERQRERERVCARDGEWLKMELVSVIKRPLEEGLTILGFLENLM